MINLTIITTLFVLSVLITLIKARNLRHQNSKQQLKQPKLYLYVGILTSLASLFILAISIYAEGYMGLFFLIPLSPFILASVWVIIYQKNWKLIIKDTNLIYTNCFNKHKTYEIKKIKVKTNTYRYDIIYNNKCVLKISFMLPQSDEFIKELKFLQLNNRAK